VLVGVCSNILVIDDVVGVDVLDAGVIGDKRDEKGVDLGG
jgi:hypothetical protein